MLLILIGVIIGFYVLYLILMTVVEHSGIVEELQEIKVLLKEIRDSTCIVKDNEEEKKEEMLLGIDKCPACGTPLTETNEACPSCRLSLNNQEE
ncbi:MAG: hypothetical protein H9893_03505 [Candidatus Niameybacter stercoravium]|nr:hypothetical protein [Candidatus Niameybacter stercoravium]